MEWIKVEPGRAGEAAARAAQVLLAGGIIIFPAERLYGIGADATDPEAVKRVFALKGRPAAQPLPVIVADREEAKQWVQIPPAGQDLMERFWPGPLTLVLPATRELPPELVAAGRLGIRVPGNELAREIARRAGRPVTATSANPSGRGSPSEAKEAAAGLSGEVDLVLDAGPLAGPPGSTVVSIEAGGIKILRPGVIGPEELEPGRGRNIKAR